MSVLDFLAGPLAIAGGGISDLLNPAKWLDDAIGGGRPAASGVRVSHQSALNLSAYFACIRNVAEDLGKLPWVVEKKVGKVVNAAPDHPLATLLANKPNPELGSQQFRELMLTWALGFGNGRAQIERDAMYRPIALWPIPPNAIRLWRDPQTGKAWYYVHPFPGFAGGLLDLEDVWDLHGLGPDGIDGWSIATLARQDLGNALAAQEFQGSLYANGVTQRLALKYPKKLTDERQIRRMRRQWVENYGSPSGSAKPIILEGGMEAQVLSINPADAQFIESVKEGTKAIARWFRMPIHKLATLEDATLNNVEQLAIEYVTDTIVTWAVRLEGESDRKLLAPGDTAAGYRTRIDLDALSRGDRKTRAEAQRTQIQAGVKTPNEVRAENGDNPHPDPAADELWMQGANAPIRLLAKGQAPKALGAGGGAPASDGAPVDGNAAPADGSGDTTTGAAAAAADRALDVIEVARAVRSAAEAALPALQDAGLRIARRQEKALARALGAHAGDDAAFAAWAAEHFAAEAGVVRELVAPAIATMIATAVALGAPRVGQLRADALAVTFATRYGLAAATSAIERRAHGLSFDAAREGALVAKGILGDVDRALEALEAKR